MGTITISEQTFEATITDHDIVLIDWWASWCGPCRMFAPIFEAAAARHDDIIFAKVDTEVEAGLARAAGIMSIPTLMAFREGVLVFSQPGHTGQRRTSTHPPTAPAHTTASVTIVTTATPVGRGHASRGDSSVTADAPNWESYS